MDNKKIKIMKNGPYEVTGSIPLKEMIISRNDTCYFYKEGRNFDLKKTYYLCRCGKSKTPPYCDGSHSHVNFDGTLTAQKVYTDEEAKKYEGKNLLLKDWEILCAFARFCHSSEGDVWTVTEEAKNKYQEDWAVKMACECPSGRLVMIDKKTGLEIEPAFEPSIVILQDPLRDCSGPLWVRGRIPIEDETGSVFQIRNRVTLCRCGASTNKPFCDARHVSIGFQDDFFKKNKS